MRISEGLPSRPEVMEIADRYGARLAQFRRVNLMEERTLFINEGRLRGCIGTIHGRYSVEDEIINNAIAAATEDSRFYPASIEELDDIEISVDILESEETVSSISELDPKIYGVIVEQGYKRGLLLPNLVGVDSAEDQIKIAKEKAGIKDGEYKIKKFKVTRL